MPLVFPNLAGTRVVMAFASTYNAVLSVEEKKQPVMTFYSPEFMQNLRGQHHDRGNLHPILGFGRLFNLTIHSPNGAFFGAALNDAKTQGVRPRLEYIQHYQTVHHTFLGDNELIPGSDCMLTSKSFRFIWRESNAK
jgi:hypothetical protein